MAIRNVFIADFYRRTLDKTSLFLRSLVFLDAKRPITIDVLNRIDLERVAERVNRVTEAHSFLMEAAGFEDKQPLLVFEKKAEYRTKGDSARRIPRRR